MNPTKTVLAFAPRVPLTDSERNHYPYTQVAVRRITCWSCRGTFNLRETSIGWDIANGLFVPLGKQVATFCTHRCRKDYERGRNRSRGVGP